MRSMLMLMLVLVGCAPKPAATFFAGLGELDAGVSCECAAWGNPRNLGDVSDRIVELSGLVASRAHPGVLYAHNDSGDTAHFFAMSPATPLAEYVLDGATNVDWEDIGLGPCPSGTCVFLGDIGDNRRVRSDYAVYRVPEPSPGSELTSVSWEKLPYQYPNGDKHNAEALFVHPKTGRVYVVTKEDAGIPSEVYRFPEPLTPSQQVTLEKVATLKFPASSDAMLTAADVSPCGNAVLLRMYNRVVELRLADPSAGFETIFGLEPVTVTTPDEPQGEAVAYSADGRSFYTASEKIVAPVPLYQMRCK